MDPKITEKEIKFWSNYAKNMTFKSSKEAQQWLFEKLERLDQEYASILPVAGTKANKLIAKSMPLYQSGKSFKIGRRLQKPKWRWDQIEIKRSSLSPLIEAGFVSIFDNPKLSPIKLVPIKDLHPTEKDALTAEGQEKVQKLAEQIKDGYFKAIIYDVSGAIVDGHHRYYAAILLKQTKIPAQLLTTDS